MKTLRRSFFHFNSFFGSVVQRDRPVLRREPAGVVPIVGITELMLDECQHARRSSTHLDSINRKHGINSSYSGARQHAIGHEAAPMRIASARVPMIADCCANASSRPWRGWPIIGCEGRTGTGDWPDQQLVLWEYLKRPWPCQD